jgi:sigma-B regulation protein RsbU (phosphoserine phosphatase)
MRILIAEDNLVSKNLLNVALKKWGHEVVAVDDGKAAWEELQKSDAPKLVILDWNMPEMDGLQVCQRVRESGTPDPPYIIILTARTQKKDIVQALEAGANDYMTKPFNNMELRARVRVGQRMIEMKEKLALQVQELRTALEHIKTLQGIIPICSFCKKIRDDQGYWSQVEAYLSLHSDARFSHGFCPECMGRHFPEIENKIDHS